MERTLYRFASRIFVATTTSPSEEAGASGEAAGKQERPEDRRLVNVGVGIGLSIMLYSIADARGPYLVGAIPLLVAVALLAYVYGMAEPIERI